MKTPTSPDNGSLAIRGSSLSTSGAPLRFAARPARLRSSFRAPPCGPELGQELLGETEHALARVFRLGVQAAVGGDALHGGRPAQTAERLEQRSAGASLGGADRGGRPGSPAAHDDNVIYVR